MECEVFQARHNYHSKNISTHQVNKITSIGRTPPVVLFVVLFVVRLHELIYNHLKRFYITFI
jgi:hypothetical protein